MSSKNANSLAAPPMDPRDLVSMWPVPEEKTEAILLDNIEASPTNPRQSFPEDHIEALAANIREQGLIQPITVRPLYSVTATLSDGSHTFTLASCDGAQKWLAQVVAALNGRAVENVVIGSQPSQYEIVAGECRWRAYKLLAERDGKAFRDILCIIRDLGDDQVREIQLSENTHRKDLTSLELARTYSELVEIERAKKTVDPMAVVAKRLGVSKSVIAQTIQMLKSIPEVLRAVELELITKSHAIDAVRLEPAQQMQYLSECLLGYFAEEEVKAGLDDPTARNAFQTESVASMKAWTERELERGKNSNAAAPLFGDGESEDDGEDLDENEIPEAPAAERGVCTECGCTDEIGSPSGCGWANEDHTLCTACAESAIDDANRNQSSTVGRAQAAANKRARLKELAQQREHEIRQQVAMQAVANILKGIADTAGKRRQAMNADDLVDVGVAFYYTLPIQLRERVAVELGIVPFDPTDYLECCNVAGRGMFLVLCSLSVALVHGVGGQIYDAYAKRYSVDAKKIEAKLRAAQEKAAKKGGRR